MPNLMEFEPNCHDYSEASIISGLMKIVSTLKLELVSGLMNAICSN